VLKLRQCADQPCLGFSPMSAVLQAGQGVVTQLQWSRDASEQRQQHTWNSSCSKDRTACCSIATESWVDILLVVIEATG
jgi:hypothetical protein